MNRKNTESKDDRHYRLKSIKQRIESAWEVIAILCYVAREGLTEVFKQKLEVYKGRGRLVLEKDQPDRRRSKYKTQR